MKIYKYILHPGIEQDVSMPMGARILSVQNQNNSITMWALVDPTNIPVTRKFSVVGTGWDCENYNTFIGTVQFDWLVWHVFEVD